MKNKSLLMTVAILSIAICSVAQENGKFKDSRDGKTYKTIKIVTQTWMAENLAYKTSNGCLAYNNSEKDVALYGYLYNWEAAKKACPSGWHVPSDAEWDTLVKYLGGKDVAGGKLKSKTGWISPNTGATNESGFTAFPNGYLQASGLFSIIGEKGYWWSSTEAYSSVAFNFLLYYNKSSVDKGYYPETMGFSVRCLKD